VHILGTAGHVDHGKSSLVRALTGTNPDRWAEEQRRGMTLDLGFAHLRFSDGLEAGIVDVPGHERFLHNMLAGAAGMEVLVLVVSATEGPRPQTHEHLAIAAYLNVKRTVVALTKADLVDDEELAFAEDLAREGLAGTIAANAPLVPVSSVDGRGLDRLRGAIHAALVALPPRAPHAPAYLPIDRVFSLPGHGTIVTGTLMQGRIAVGDALALAPLGRDVRARSIQVFGERRTDADGGSRVAVNLPGVEAHEIGRGAVLADPRLVAAATLAVRFRPLPQTRALLERRTPVRVYLGSAEILGTLAFAAAPAPDGDATLEGTLHLREATIAIPGAAFVLRRLTPKVLLGGGTIAAIGGAEGAAFAAFDEGDPPETTAVLAALRGAGIGAATATAVAAAANLRAERAAELLNELAGVGRVVRLAKPPAYLDGDLAETTFGRVRSLLADHERARPWHAGSTSIGLARPLGLREAPLVRLLAPFVDDGRLTYRGGYYATPLYDPHLTPEQERFFATSFSTLPEHRFIPASLAELVAKLRPAAIDGLAEAFETLVARGSLVKVGADLYRGVQMAEIRQRIEALLRARERATPAEFRDAIGTSRKYVVPLLEYFDATGFTVRAGDLRVLREARPKRPSD